jgi:hypothetical protein
MIQRGGRAVAGFGVGLDIEEVTKKLDPLYECHNDTYSKLTKVGYAVAGGVTMLGILYIVIPWLDPLPIRRKTDGQGQDHRSEREPFRHR